MFSIANSRDACRLALLLGGAVAFANQAAGIVLIETFYSFTTEPAAAVFDAQALATSTVDLGNFGRTEFDVLSARDTGVPWTIGQKLVWEHQGRAQRGLLTPEIPTTTYRTEMETMGVLQNLNGAPVTFNFTGGYDNFLNPKGSSGLYDGYAATAMQVIGQAFDSNDTLVDSFLVERSERRDYPEGAFSEKITRTDSLTVPTGGYATLEIIAWAEDSNTLVPEPNSLTALAAVFVLLLRRRLSWT